MHNWQPSNRLFFFVHIRLIHSRMMWKYELYSKPDICRFFGIIYIFFGPPPPPPSLLQQSQGLQIGWARKNIVETPKIAIQKFALICAADRCRTFKCAAVCCSVLQCVAVSCHAFPVSSAQPPPLFPINSATVTPLPNTSLSPSTWVFSLPAESARGASACADVSEIPSRPLASAHAVKTDTSLIEQTISEISLRDQNAAGKYEHIHWNIHAFIQHTFKYLYVYVCIYIYIHTCNKYVYIYIYMYIYTYVYICKHM